MPAGSTPAIGMLRRPYVSAESKLTSAVGWRRLYAYSDGFARLYSTLRRSSSSVRVRSRLVAIMAQMSFPSFGV
eukprot:5414246-Prymnesium_polylepis.1